MGELLGGRCGSVPVRAQLLHGNPRQVPENNTSGIPVGRCPPRRIQLGEVVGDHRHQLRKCNRNLLDTPGLGIPADEDGVHNGRSCSVDMNGSSHLRGARQHSRTGEISVKDRKPDGAVGIQLVVVIGENQGRFGLQRLCHAGIDAG